MRDMWRERPGALAPEAMGQHGVTIAPSSGITKELTMRPSIATVLALAVFAPAAARADAALSLAPAVSTPATSTDPATTTATSIDTPSHEGMTAELGIGVSMINGTDLTTLGVGLGVGVWQSPQTAVTLRVAASVDRSELGGVAVAAFVGPSVQRFLTEKLWLAGGAGLAVAVASPAYSQQRLAGAFERGFAVDFRLGYTVASSLDVSLELTPQWYDDFNQAAVGLLVGYQLR
jgi:hypothetical protein